MMSVTEICAYERKDRRRAGGVTGQCDRLGEREVKASF